MFVAILAYTITIMLKYLLINDGLERKASSMGGYESGKNNSSCLSAGGNVSS